MSIELTKKELSDLAGYSYRRLHDIDEGLPDNKKLFVKGEGAKCDLALFLRRWVAYNTERAKGEEDDLEAVKARHESVKMERSQLELGRLRGEIVFVADVRIVWKNIAAMVKQRLLYLPNKLATQLMMIDNAEAIEAIIDREMRDALTMIADTPLPSSIPQTGDSDDEAEGE